MMKKYLNISFFFSTILIVSSSIGFVGIYRTGCTSGYWGFGSCGKGAIASSVIILLIGIYGLYLSITSHRAKSVNKKIASRKEKKF